MKTTQKPSIEAGRARLIKQIHVARRELERAGTLDEAGYREMLRAASGGRHESCAGMSYRDLNAALERFKSAGFKPRKAAGDRTQAVTPIDRKVRALWLFLHDLEVVKDPSEKALATYVKRVAKVDALQWANGERTLVVIESLKKWAMRFLPAAVRALFLELRDLHAVEPLTEVQQQCAQRAQAYLSRGDGFDMHSMAWENLRIALRRPISSNLDDLPRQQGAQ